MPVIIPGSHVKKAIVPSKKANMFKATWSGYMLSSRPSLPMTSLKTILMTAASAMVTIHKAVGTVTHRIAHTFRLSYRRGSRGAGVGVVSAVVICVVYQKRAPVDGALLEMGDRLAVAFLCFVSSGFLCFVCKFCFASFGCGSTVLEAVDTTFGVDDLLFTSKERV